MTAKTLIRSMSLLVLVAGGVVACATSEESGPGVTNAQGGGRCLPRGSHCVMDDDCCTLWCANNVCVHKSP
ncbi:MAG: hypothetical protein WBY94_13345 [Polyangiaceae bacterium]